MKQAQVIQPLDRRITPGAEIKEWRLVPSLRRKLPGHFLQGGHYEQTPRGNSFIKSFKVGDEIHFPGLSKKAVVILRGLARLSQQHD